jgi:hypothetical protein
VSEPSAARRGTLRLLAGGLSAGLLGGLAGCLSPYEDVPASAPTIPTGVRVTDAHLRSARERYERAERDRQDALATTDEADLAAMPDWVGDDDVGAWRPAVTDRPRWPAVREYRAATQAAVNEAAYVRAWRGDITRSDAEARVADRSVPDYADVPTDRGEVAGGLVNAAAAQYRLHEARDAAGRARAAVERVPAETAGNTLPEEFAGTVVVALRNAVESQLAADDVRRLGTAYPPGPAHASAFRRAARRFAPVEEDVATLHDVAVGWDAILGYADPPNVPDDLAGLARWERAEHGVNAAAALHGTRAVVLDGVAETVRTAEASVGDAPSPRRLGEAGRRAHAAVRDLLADADPLTHALLSSTAGALREATSTVESRRGSVLPGESHERLVAFLQFRTVAAVAAAVPDARDRLLDVLSA